MKKNLGLVVAQLDMLNAAGTRIWKDPAKRARVLARRATAKRRKPGRPKKANAGAPHTTREAFKPSEPVHVTLRVVEAVRGLRRRAMYHAIREATLVAARNAERFRIVHLSIQQTHVHMLVEADGKAALSRGMQGFQISAAKQINAALSKERGTKRRGRVFSDRYHAEVIRLPRQARHALAYVLRGSIKTTVDRGSRSGDQEMCLWKPRSRLARFAVEVVETRSHDSSATPVVNSTA